MVVSLAFSNSDDEESSLGRNKNMKFSASYLFSFFFPLLIHFIFVTGSFLHHNQSKSVCIFFANEQGLLPSVEEGKALSKKPGKTEYIENYYRKRGTYKE